MPQQNSHSQGNFLEKEIQFFDATAQDFWNPHGSFAPLHKMNPTRIKAIVARIAYHFERDLISALPLKGLQILDIGCGGGMVCEPLARLGATVTGVDLSQPLLACAQDHASAQGLDIRYHCISSADLRLQGTRYDVVLGLELIEHLPQPQALLDDMAALMQPQGMAFCSTINRSKRAYLQAILIAERVLRWLPKDTHNFDQFITPQECESFGRAAGLDCEEMIGFVFHPLKGEWQLSATDLSVNYMAIFKNFKQFPPMKPPLSWQ